MTATSPDGRCGEKVWDLTYDEIRAIPLGAKAAAEFRNELTNSMQPLGIAQNRIGLNIELKYYEDHYPRLAERVVEAVRSRNDQPVVIQTCDDPAGGPPARAGNTRWLPDAGKRSPSRAP